MNWRDMIGKVTCGDCLELMKGMEDGCVDLVVTDPPYNVGLDYGEQTDDERNDYEKWIKVRFKEMMRISKRILITPGTLNEWYYPIPKWMLIWVRSNALSFSTIKGRHVYDTILWYGDSPVNPIGRDVIDIPITKQPDTGNHPCPKPLKLFKRLVDMASIKDDLICDPMCGSGTTLVAAKQLGRRFIGFDISEDYCNIARERLRQEVMEFTDNKKE